MTVGYFMMGVLYKKKGLLRSDIIPHKDLLVGDTALLVMLYMI